MTGAVEVITGLPIAIAGGLIGVWATRRHYLQDAKRRQLSHVEALQAEVEYCDKHATVYKTQRYVAPLYRFPMDAYRNAYPSLLFDGLLSRETVESLIRFYSQVEQMNRGLDDLSQLVRESGMEKVKQREFKRLLEKANEFESDGLTSPIRESLHKLHESIS